MPVDQLGGDRGVGGQLGGQTQPRVLADGVGGQGDGRPDLGQLGGLLEHVRLDAALLQREAEGQPPDAGTDDRYAQLGISHAHEGDAPAPGFAPAWSPGFATGAARRSRYRLGACGRKSVPALQRRTSIFAVRTVLDEDRDPKVRTCWWWWPTT